VLKRLGEDDDKRKTEIRLDSWSSYLYDLP
jgi:hypothetical protein